jgi:hypothetical protein
MAGRFGDEANHAAPTWAGDLDEATANPFPHDAIRDVEILSQFLDGDVGVWVRAQVSDARHVVERLICDIR